MQVIDPSYAQRPPMGWNSWDCFGVNVTEAEVRANADFMAEHLKVLGWEYVVVDLGWYAPEATKDNYKGPKIPMIIDAYGRLQVDETRFPSAAGGQGFKPLADYVHSLGLKFGIHIMRGMPWISYEQNTPIKGTDARAQDVGNPNDMCLWYNSMYGIDMTHPAGQAYYHSLIELYTSWGVDFIKADDLGSWDGDGMFSNYRLDEVEGLSIAMAAAERPLVLSISPGAAYIGLAKHLRRHAHMWRISADFWDDWPALKRQFERCALWASRSVPGAWPDADMLPLGKIGIRGEIGTPRQTNFTEDEQYTLMTLWCIFRNPLMFGGHLPESDALSLQLITNPEVLAVNQASKENRQLERTEHSCTWLARAEDDSALYLALFNLSDEGPRPVEVNFSALGTGNTYAIRDCWERRDLGIFTAGFAPVVASHGAGLYRLEIK
ncbi:glycoside hydrolase family 27 protein [Neolewinella lacunae]|uniref:Alpha-galactosidase n=1 Tax=Neolewinella lacunae TaxID=1517758 RepID=A0A923PJ39_9BACT|nr:glycoside hydrolase family 27 protein [Neolewinella lacunae]MBC6995078.1 glycoside hydrolase family 27 protein [Neolewinella lacunae]MDN3635373.1 glycoside hydrolase family 27 protein [Neolewinella lacunae]